MSDGSKTESAGGHAREDGSRGPMSDFFDFIKSNKAWWITPIIVVLLVIGVLMILTGTAATPFIYSLF